jgi:hypothetical protein
MFEDKIRLNENDHSDDRQVAEKQLPAADRNLKIEI